MSDSNQDNKKEEITPNENEIENEAQDTNQVQQESEQTEKKVTIIQAQINLFKGMVGLGVLALPIGFSQAGWLSGIILIPVVGYAMYYCSDLMLGMADERNINPEDISQFCYMIFHQKGQKNSGKGARAMTIVFLFFLQLGISISYPVFFMNYIQETFCYYGWEDGCDNRLYSVFLCLLLVIPLGLIRNMDGLKTPLNIGTYVMLFAIGVMIYECFNEMGKNGPKFEKTFDFWNLSSLVGIVVFTFEGVGVLFNVRHSLENPKELRGSYINVVNASIFLYLLIGICGYLAYGNESADLLLFNLPMENKFYQSVYVMYSLVLALTLPLQIFPMANYIEIEMKKSIFYKPQQQEQNQDQEGEKLPETTENQQQEQQQQQQERQEILSNGSVDPNKIQLTKEEEERFLKYSYGMRTAFVLSIFCIAMTLTKVSVFLNFAGSIGGIALLYVIPIVTYNLSQLDVSQKVLITNWVIGGIGIFAGLCGIYTSGKEIYADMENGFDFF